MLWAMASTAHTESRRRCSIDPVGMRCASDTYRMHVASLSSLLALDMDIDDRSAVIITADL